MQLVTQSEFVEMNWEQQKEVLRGLGKTYYLEATTKYIPLPDDSHELEPEPEEKTIRIPTRTARRLHNLYATWVQEEVGISLENW